ncbi:hypothetical protein MLD38_018670 [Melastoma candidum]|uniref:Uncharacterized protein n=1 Tax=Melastoma candidum TaxID=119954 RepID=A0ACB9QVV4_9MYRT|nr:hypothetical protein MLD38_018670 [Melastoma candidum]
MSSLQDLLADEGFRSRTKSSKSVTSRRGSDPVVLPIYLCRDGMSPVCSVEKPPRPHRRRGSSVLSSSERASFASRRSNYDFSALSVGKDEEPSDGATNAVLAILGGYVGRYIKDESFRDSIREKYEACVAGKKAGSLDDEAFERLEEGIDGIEKLVRNLGGRTPGETAKLLRFCTRQLSFVASLASDVSHATGTTCGVPNSYLSACAWLYLSIACRIERSTSTSAQHLLQVFCDSPFLARTRLLPDLWEHLFLPHLLHLRIWYNNELESVSSSKNFESDSVLKSLSKLYNEKMDIGTARFAIYYKQRLKVGAGATSVPVALTLKHRHGELSRRKSLEHRRVSMDLTSGRRLQRRNSMDSWAPNVTIDKNPYRAAAPEAEQERRMRSLDFNLGEHERIRKGGSVNNRAVGESRFSSTDNHKRKFRREQRELCTNGPVEQQSMSRQSSYVPLLSCPSETTTCSTSRGHITGNNQMECTMAVDYPPDGIRRAISTICSSDILGECEAAIHIITKAWLGLLNGDQGIEPLVSEPSFVKGTLEILFASNDDEVLELAVLLLAEIVVRNSANGQTILSLDPKLDVFLRLLRRTSIFLKAVVLLYILKPRAKMMASTEWVPLILRVLEFGDHTQTLFKFRCVPRIAALYILNQLLLGFDEDKNLENARELVSLGGLTMLMETFRSATNLDERKDIMTFIICCIKAEGMCRNYVAENISHASVLELLILELHRSSTSALSLLTELLCLNRRSKIDELLTKIRTGWAGLRTVDILLIYLQKSSLMEKPVVAAVLLLFDILGDYSSESSFYREEAIDAIITALDCESSSQRAQEQSTRCLLILGGQFSEDGMAVIEQWLLERSGFQDSRDDTIHGRDLVIAIDKPLNGNEARAWRWQREVALVLLNGGRGSSFLLALSNSMENGISTLSRACLVTVSWLTSFIHMADDKRLLTDACSILVRQMLRSLNFDRDLEERVLATAALLNLVKNSGCFSMVYPLNEDTAKLLHNLSLVTWTAKELLSMENTASRKR